MRLQLKYSLRTTTSDEMGREITLVSQGLDAMQRLGVNVEISRDAHVDVGAVIWNGTCIREGASVSAGTSIGRNAYLGPGVKIGKNCKIQNGALIYEPTTIGDGVFIGPSAIFTNDQYPRAILPDGTPKTEADWRKVGVTVNEGASVGAGAICVAPLILGRWCMIAAGSVVTNDVPPFALVAGVPARQIGWVGKYGAKLTETAEGFFVCPESGESYELTQEGLKPIHE